MTDNLTTPEQPAIDGVSAYSIECMRLIQACNNRGIYPDRIQIKLGTIDGSYHMPESVASWLLNRNMIELHKFEIGAGMRWKLSDAGKAFLKSYDDWAAEWEPELIGA